MKIQIKFTDDDKWGFRQNKTLKIVLLILGVILTLIEVVGLIIDFIFPSYSSSYRAVAGQFDIKRLLTGGLLLFAYYLLSRDPKKSVN